MANLRAAVPEAKLVLAGMRLGVDIAPAMTGHVDAAIQTVAASLISAWAISLLSELTVRSFAHSRLRCWANSPLATEPSRICWDGATDVQRGGQLWQAIDSEDRMRRNGPRLIIFHAHRVAFYVAHDKKG